MIKINYLYNEKPMSTYAKLEYYNITGSIKDRLIYYVLDKENLNKSIPLTAVTSGNTGISLASYGARFGHPVHIFMPDYVSTERVKLLEIFGAHINLISRSEGGFKKCIELAKDFTVKHNAYLFDQFNTIENINCHYNTTGLEIINSLNYVDKFVSGIGTGGTLIGTGKRLKEKYGSKIIAIEPDTLPILKNKEAKGKHKIDGIGDDFIPSIVDLNLIDEIIDINDEDAINMALKFSKELGLGIGISSATNFLGSVISNKGNEKIVTIFADDNKKYLSTFKEKIKTNENFISEKIKLVNFEIVN